MSRQHYEFWMRVENETDKAVLLSDIGRKFWLPFSRIRVVKQPFEKIGIGDMLTVSIPEWLARKNGLL